jgi:RNA polymerase sigma factor (sigma-70 family)
MSTLEFNYQVTVHSQTLKAHAYQFTKNIEDAEDLIQDTLLKALRYKDYFEEGTNFRGWLFTIMRNIFINGFKRRKLQQQHLQTATAQGKQLITGGSENSITGDLSAKEIIKAIDNLAIEYRKPFQMHIEGFQYEEIATEMGIPVGTVKSRIFHARQKLSKQLSDFR